MSDEPEPLLYSFVYGSISMLCFHNFFVSIDHYRNGRSFSILKIIFNLSSSLDIIFLFLYDIVPSDVTLNTCRALTYLLGAANFIRSESLAIFLLWRLKRIVDTRWDKFISYFLLSLRTCFQIIFIASAHVINRNNKNSIGLLNTCNVDLDHISKMILWGFILTDLIIDTYVISRMTQILIKGSRKAAQVDSITGRTPPNRKLFNAVICWNYLRMTSVLALNIFTIVIFLLKDPFVSNTLRIIKILNYIAISYLVTIDKEIVRVIVGKEGDEDSEDGKVPIMYDYTIENSRYSISITKNLPPRKSISNKIIASFNNNNVKLDANIIRSSQKLTFVEWACMVGWDIQGLEERTIEGPRSRSSSTFEIEDHC